MCSHCCLAPQVMMHRILRRAAALQMMSPRSTWHTGACAVAPHAHLSSQLPLPSSSPCIAGVQLGRSTSYAEAGTQVVGLLLRVKALALLGARARARARARVIGGQEVAVVLVSRAGRSDDLRRGVVCGPAHETINGMACMAAVMKLATHLMCAADGQAGCLLHILMHLAPSHQATPTSRVHITHDRTSHTVRATAMHEHHMPRCLCSCTNTCHQCHSGTPWSPKHPPHLAPLPSADLPDLRQPAVHVAQLQADAAHQAQEVLRVQLSTQRLQGLGTRAVHHARPVRILLEACQTPACTGCCHQMIWGQAGASATWQQDGPGVIETDVGSTSRLSCAQST
jgi:hypothetical protein